jgi:hypothetical protein
MLRAPMVEEGPVQLSSLHGGSTFAISLGRFGEM